MNPVLVGNIIFFVGAMIMILTGFIQTKKRILAAQCVQFTIMGIGQIFLGGTSGLISNIVSILRNLICMRWEYKAFHKYIFMIVQIGLTLLIMPAGVIGWLPTVAVCLFTWFLDTRSEVLLKVIIILCQFLWIVYDASILNFTGLVLDAVTVFTNVAGIVMLKKASRSEKI